MLFSYHKKINKILPQIRSKNRNKKKLAKNLLTNMKILLFMNKNKIKSFFGLIQKKYEKEFSSFIKYFYTNYFNKYPINEINWNYDLDFIFENNNL